MVASGAVLIAAPASMVDSIYPGVLPASTNSVNNGRFRIQATGPVAGSIYGSRHVFSATQNLSNAQLLFAAGSSSGNSNLTTVTNLTIPDGAMFALFDGSGNYRRWNIFSGAVPITISPENAAPIRPYCVDPSCTISMQEQSATPPNLTNIVAFELHMKPSSTSTVNFRISSIYRTDKTNNIQITGGTEAAPAGFSDLTDYQAATANLFFVEELGRSGVYSLVTSINQKADVFSSVLDTISFATPSINNLLDPRCHVNDHQLNVAIPNDGSCEISGIQVKSGFRALSGSQSLGLGANLELSNFIYGTVSDLVLSTGTFSNGAFSDFGQIEINGAGINNASFQSGSLLILSALGSTSTITTVAVDKIRFDLPPGSYSNLRGTIAPGQAIDITQGAGTYTIDRLEGGTVAQPVVIDNTVGGAVTVIVGAGIEAVAASPVTAGTITIQAPQVSLSAPGIKDPTYPISVALLRQETFVIPNITAAINTTTNTLTLTDHRLTLTTPASFLALVPQPGATMPTDADGPLEAMGLYFVQSISGDSITLSRSEGGTVIDLLTAGTGTFVVRAWSQLDYELVPAGSASGYSVELSEPAGTTLLLKARGHQSAVLPATATEYLIREIAWGATSQSLPDTLDFASAPDTIYNAITAASEYTNNGGAVTGISFDLDGTVQFDFDGGATIPTQDVYAWYVHYTSTEEGIRYVGAVVQALNSANINVAPPIQFENIDIGTVLRLTGAFIRRTDGANLTFIGATSGVIEYDFDQLAVPFTVTTGSGLDGTQSTQLTTLFNATTAGTGATVFSEVALANAPSGGGSGGGASAEAIADAVWDELLSGHVIDGSAGKVLADASTFDPSVTTVDANVTQISGDSAAANNLEALLDGTGGTLTGNINGAVTNLTNLPPIPNNWLTGAGIATSARQAFVDSGLLGVTGGDFAIEGAPLTSPFGRTRTIIGNQQVINGNINASRETILTRGNEAWVTANISSLLTTTTYANSLPPNFGTLAITPTTGLVSIDASSLATSAALTTVAAVVDSIKAKSDLLNFTGTDVRATLDGETVLVGDKTGFSLTLAERTAIATATEAALINEGDGQQLIDAILQVINSNLNLPALELVAIGQAVRNEIAVELGRLDATITSRLATTGYIAPDNSGITELQNRITALRAGYLDKLNVTGILANTDNAATFRTDLTPVLTAIAPIPTNPLLATNYVAPDNAGIANIPNLLSNLQSYGDLNWTTATVDLSTIQANIGLLLDKNMLTINKPVAHSPSSIVIGANEAIISLTVDENTDTVTGVRTS